MSVGTARTTRHRRLRDLLRPWRRASHPPLERREELELQVEDARGRGGVRDPALHGRLREHGEDCAGAPPASPRRRGSRTRSCPPRACAMRRDERRRASRSRTYARIFFRIAKSRRERPWSCCTAENSAFAARREPRSVLGERRRRRAASTHAAASAAREPLREPADDQDRRPRGPSQGASANSLRAVRHDLADTTSANFPASSRDGALPSRPCPSASPIEARPPAGATETSGSSSPGLHEHASRGAHGFSGAYDGDAVRGAAQRIYARLTLDATPARLEKGRAQRGRPPQNSWSSAAALKTRRERDSRQKLIRLGRYQVASPRLRMGLSDSDVRVTFLPRVTSQGRIDQPEHRRPRATRLAEAIDGRRGRCRSRGRARPG